MSITPDQIESLLHEDEGTSLDFKRDQYDFERANNNAKSELLKDILAFTNAFRRADAYILIGVEEVRGCKSNVVGIATQLDDAKLQQFVNSKTQRPVTFSYHEATHDGHEIGIIHIPIQRRPIYTKVNFGKVKMNEVYLRRGSSTAVAEPDEIALMGTPGVSSANQPTVELNIVNRKTGISLGERAIAEECTWFDVPPDEEIPDYSADAFLNPLTNRGFFRDAAKFIQTSSCFEVALELRNTGGIVVHNAALEFELHDPERCYEMLKPQDRAEQPTPHGLMGSPITPIFAQNPDVSVAREGEVWKVVCTFGKIQPERAARLQDDLLIGARNAGDVTIPGRVYADNISNPIPVQIQLSFQSGARRFTAEEIRHIAGKHFR